MENGGGCVVNDMTMRDVICMMFSMRYVGTVEQRTTTQAWLGEIGMGI